MQDNETGTQQDATTPSAPGDLAANPSITDPTWLFRLSGLVDMIRDAAHFFVGTGVTDRDAIAPLAERYLQLRDRIPAALGDIEASQTSQWGHSIDPASVSAAGLFAAASMLARWCDLLYQTPTFVTQQKMALASAQKVSREIDAVLQSGTGSVAAPQDPRGGTYL